MSNWSSEDIRLIGAMQRIATQSVSVPKEQLLQETAAIGQELINVPVVIIWELDRADGHLKVTAHAGKVGYEYRDKVQIDSQSAATRYFLDSRSPLAFQNLQDAPSYAHKKEAEAQGWVSLISAPAIVEDEVIGIIDAYTYDSRTFSATEKEAFSVFATQVAIALQGIQRAARLVQLHRTTATISAEPPDLARVLDLIAAGVGELFYGAACSIRLYDRTQDTFLPQVGTGVLEDLIDQPPSKQGSSRYVVGTRSPRYLTGSELENPPDGGPPVRENIRERGIKAAAYLPLLRGESIIGILYVDLLVPHRFSRDDKQILELFADQAAIAVVNARQRAEDIAALQEINAAIPTESWEGISALVAQEARALTQADYSGLWVKESENWLALGAMRGTGTESLKAPGLAIDPSSINGWVALTGEPYFCPDVQAGDPHYQKWREGIQSSGAVPIMLGEELLGTLSIESYKQRAFSSYHIRLLQSVANQAAVALHNADLFEQLQEREEQLEEIVEGTPVPTFVIDDNHVVLYWNAACAELTGIPAGEIIGTKNQWKPFYPEERPVMADLIVDNAPELKVAEFYPEKYQPSAAIEGAWAAEDFFPHFGEHGRRLFFTAAPLKDRDGRVIGAIETLQDFTERRQAEEELLQKVEQIDLFNEITKIIAERAPELATVLDMIAKGIAREFADATCEFRFFDPETSQFAAREGTGVARERSGYPPRKDGTSDQVRQTQEAFYAESPLDKLDDGRPAIRDEIRARGIQAVATLPLISDQETIGILYVDWKEPRRFSDDDKHILEAFSAQAAVAIENAELFRRQDELRVREMEAATRLDDALADIETN